MTPQPWLDDGDVKLYAGDARAQLALMPSESVQCIVTSPPFWGLRDYNHPDQIGLEDTPDAWCARLVRVMREARRVLRNDGTCWLECGDSYAGSNRGGAVSNEAYARLQGDTTKAVMDGGTRPAIQQLERCPPVPSGLKHKDLCGAPWMLAFALRADGWYLRSDTIWSRPNPMPESVTDRPTKAHSYVFLLTKAARYFYDADAIREAHVESNAQRTTKHYDTADRYGAGNGGNGGLDGLAARMRSGEHAGRNARSVWTIPTQPTPFAHFATFPEALVERCIKASTSEHGACSECGAPWRRITERDPSQYEQLGKHNGADFDRDDSQPQSLRGTSRGNQTRTASGTVPSLRPRVQQTTGWEASCAHDAPVVPCRVLDCFMGSGTTALVARRLGRHAIGIELSAEYLAIAAERLQQPTLWSQPV